VKVFVPVVIFSFILSVIEALLGLLVISLLLLQQAKSWMQMKQDINVIIGFILFACLEALNMFCRNAANNCISRNIL
jgi:uncharacterized membrane protein